MPAGLDGNPDPIATPSRDAVLASVADEICSRRAAGRPFLVGIDGIDGSGKTTFADELAALLSVRTVPVVRATIDSFHHPRNVRYRRGRESPVGFYLDSHDLAALQEQLLAPFLAGAGATYRTAVFDEPSDQLIDEPPQTIDGDEVLVFDGVFLGRPELAGSWDLTVFLDAQERVDLTRLGHVLAAAPAAGVELIDHVLRWAERIDRYSAGMRYYLDTANPRAHADVVIDNNDLANPTIVTP